MNTLKITRVIHGLKQEDLAQQIGRSQSWLSRVESGKLLPQRAEAEKIAEALSHNLSDLLHAA